MFNVSFLLAFWTGVVSFFAPCLLPLLPAYVGYIAGVSFEDLKNGKGITFSKNIFLSSLFYILGFSVIFVILGTAAGSIGVFFRRNDLFIQRLGGLIILIFGLQFSGLVNIPALAKERRLKLPIWANKLGYVRSFLVGVIFATTWTPCIGAVLGSILTLAAISATAVKGAALLFVYSLGIALPFLLVSFGLALAPRYISFISKRMAVISRVTGIILVVLGVLLLTNTYRYLNGWLFDLAYRLGYQIK